MPRKARTDRLKSIEERMKKLNEEKKRIEALEREEERKAHAALLQALGEAAYKGGLRKPDDVLMVCAEAAKLPALKDRFTSHAFQE